jgi:hypothetical protein
MEANASLHLNLSTRSFEVSGKSESGQVTDRTTRVRVIHTHGRGYRGLVQAERNGVFIL